jgi:hypothetical protein
MWSEPTKTARAGASASRARWARNGRPRIENSSSEPCAFTANGAPAAAATAPPGSTWFAKTRIGRKLRADGRGVRLDVRLPLRVVKSCR